MKKIFALLITFIIFCSPAAFAQNTISHSAITFKVKNLGISFDGTIGGLQTAVHFNPADLTASTIEASVDVNTISTDNSLRDEHLKSDEFMDAPHYPKITLKSLSIKHRIGDRYTGKFNLTIKDKTQTVEIPFTYAAKGDLKAFNGKFKINRLDYGVGESSFTLSNEIIISVDAELRE